LVYLLNGWKLRFEWIDNQFPLSFLARAKAAIDRLNPRCSGTVVNLGRWNPPKGGHAGGMISYISPSVRPSDQSLHLKRESNNATVDLGRALDAWRATSRPVRSSGRRTRTNGFATGKSDERFADRRGHGSQSTRWLS